MFLSVSVADNVRQKLTSLFLVLFSVSLSIKFMFLSVSVADNVRQKLTLLFLVLFLFHYLSNSCFRLFLDASTHLYKRVCPSVGPSVRRSDRPSVRGLPFFSNRGIRLEMAKNH